jgi:hypothetical protein
VPPSRAWPLGCGSSVSEATAIRTACWPWATSTWWSSPSLQPYDIVPLIPIVEAAGGVITGPDGEAPVDGGFVVAAATPELHAQALDPASPVAVPGRHDPSAGGSALMSEYPYAERFPVNRTLPETGRPREEVLAQLQTMAKEEDAFWETGKCSGTMYCGDHDHYDFLNQAFGLFAHVNALQRDMCPSSTNFEGEIIAMALDLFTPSGRRGAP